MIAARRIAQLGKEFNIVHHCLHMFNEAQWTARSERWNGFGAIVAVIGIGGSFAVSSDTKAHNPLPIGSFTGILKNLTMSLSCFVSYKVWASVPTMAPPPSWTQERSPK